MKIQSGKSVEFLFFGGFDERDAIAIAISTISIKFLLGFFISSSERTHRVVYFEFPGRNHRLLRTEYSCAFASKNYNSAHVVLGMKFGMRSCSDTFIFIA